LEQLEETLEDLKKLVLLQPPPFSGGFLFMG